MQELVEVRAMSELKLVLFGLTFDTESGGFDKVYHSKAVRRYKILHLRLEWRIDETES
jgi:hypothetical protein